MLVITLGTVASGSTWVFNIVRALCAETSPEAVSLSCGDAADLLDNIGPKCRDIILKAHHLDVRLLTLAAVFQAKTIITTRDPRDSLVSMRERFNSEFNETVESLTRTSATFAMIDDTMSTLTLHYDNGFTDDVATVERIAAFLDLPIDQQTVQRIFHTHRAEEVSRKVDRSNAVGRLLETGFDIVSHWHQGHVGDRQIGKWRTRLAPNEQDAIVSAVGSTFHPMSSSVELNWSPRLFAYYDGRTGGAEEVLDCQGDERAMVWGPYLHLPAGRWQIQPHVYLEDSEPVSVRIDTYIPVEGRYILALRMINLPLSSPERMTMEFDHHDHLQPLELRISSINDGRRAKVRFAGASLKRLGPSERVIKLSAQPVRGSAAV